jgi:hypothetical protein
MVISFKKKLGNNCLPSFFFGLLSFWLMVVLGPLRPIVGIELPLFFYRSLLSMFAFGLQGYIDPRFVYTIFAILAPLFALSRSRLLHVLIIFILFDHMLSHIAYYYAELPLFYSLKIFLFLLHFHYSRGWKGKTECTNVIGFVFLFAFLHKLNFSFISGHEFRVAGDFHRTSDTLFSRFIGLFSPEALAAITLFFEFIVGLLCFIVPRLGALLAFLMLLLLFPRSVHQAKLLICMFPCFLYCFPFLRLSVWRTLISIKYSTFFWATLVAAIFLLIFLIPWNGAWLAIWAILSGYLLIILFSSFSHKKSLLLEWRYFFKRKRIRLGFISILCAIYGALPFFTFIPKPLSFQVYNGAVDKKNLHELVIEDPKWCSHLDSFLPRKLSCLSLVYESGSPCRLWLPSKFMLEKAKEKGNSPPPHTAPSLSPQGRAPILN